MHNAFGVGGIERVCDFDGERKKSLDLHGTSADPVLERCALEQLHGDEGLSVLIADVMDGADVGMVQSRRGLRFSLKASQRLGFAGDVFRQELEGHEAMQADVLGLIDHTHPAPA